MRKTLLTGLTTLAFTVLNAEVGLHFSGEFLWWKVVPNNQFVNIVTATPFNPPNVDTRETFYYSYGWDPGYKVGIDYSLCLDNRHIDLFATWAHFNSSDSMSIERTGVATVRSSNGLALTAIVSPGATITYDGHADFSFNRLDTGISANYFQCNNLSINPSCAFTYVHIKNSIVEDLTTLTTSQSTNIDSNFNGYGITIGGDAHYSLTHDFYIYGSTGLSALYGQYNSAINNLLVTTAIVGHPKNWKMRFIADFNVGVEYFVCLFNCMQLSARVGYEFTYLPEMNILEQVILNTAPDDLTINGLVAGLQLGF